VPVTNEIDALEDGVHDSDACMSRFWGLLGGAKGSCFGLRSREYLSVDRVERPCGGYITL